MAPARQTSRNNNGFIAILSLDRSETTSFASEVTIPGFLAMPTISTDSVRSSFWTLRHPMQERQSTYSPGKRFYCSLGNKSSRFFCQGVRLLTERRKFVFERLRFLNYCADAGGQSWLIGGLGFC